jgi:anthranilate phosphoribosyltransferase
MERHRRDQTENQTDWCAAPVRAEDELSDLIQRVFEGTSLSAAEAEAAFERFLTGSATPVEMAALLTALKLRGETAAEVAGGVRALQKAMVGVDLGADRAVDTCGTGGGSLTTFNISTAAAFVAAGGGVPIAKHGNRSFTSSCGSADVLEALGIEIELEPEAAVRVFEEAGIVFLFAPAFHPAMRHVGPVRRELGVTTIMNLLGPLANPARVRRQVVGVARPNLLTLVADALLELGHERALVVHGEPGLDELSPLGVTRGIEVEDGRTREIEIAPAELGWPAYSPDELGGGEPQANANRIRSVLRGDERGGARAAVVLNAAAAFWAAGDVDAIADGVERAEASIDEGLAWAVVERLRAATETRREH